MGSRNWWVAFALLVLALYIVMVVGLLVYHAYLIVTAQTTWEHLCRQDIDYLKPFPRTVFPFSSGGSWANAVAFLGRDRRWHPKEWQFTWQPGQPIPFNIFENDYWSCC